MVKREVIHRNINRVLIANAVILLMVLASYPVFYGVGMWSGATIGYVITAISLLVLCGVAIYISRHFSALVGLVFYCWCGFFTITTMMLMDIFNGADEFPWILYLLIFGIFCLKHFGVSFHWQIFTIATIIVVALAGVIYRQYDQAIACAATATLMALIGGNNADR